MTKATSKSALLDPENPDALDLSKLLAKTLKGSNGTKKVRKLRKKTADFLTDPQETAAQAGLRYVSDFSPGIRRLKAGKGFHYVGPDNKPVRDENVLRRIKSLAIPPAWTDVWICPISNGHLQATGRDARRRKQYRYHPRWRQTRDSTKFDRMLAFGQAMPAIRARVEEDLSRPGLPREKVLATIVRLLELTLIRVGNEEYTRANRSYGLTTLRDNHVKIYGTQIRFRFKGKGGKLHEVGVKDKRLARIVYRCREIPGQELFQYVDENGESGSVDSADVNAYLREISGQDFTAKDFRTWAATVLTAMALKMYGEAETGRGLKRYMLKAVEAVANCMGNTPAICRKSYIHPAITDGYLKRELLKAINNHNDVAVEGLAVEEVSVLSYLRSLSST